MPKIFIISMTLQIRNKTSKIGNVINLKKNSITKYLYVYYM